MAAQTRQKRHERGAFQQARAECVAQADVARPCRFHKSGHTQQRIAAKFERITKSVAHAPQHHVRAAQSVERLDEETAVAHGQVVTFHECQAEQAREVGVFEIGLVPRAGREQNDGRIVRVLRTKPAESVPPNAQRV